MRNMTYETDLNDPRVRMFKRSGEGPAGTRWRSLMNAERRIKRVWMLPVAMLAIWAAVLLSATPMPSSGQYAPIEPRLEPGASHAATEMPEPQTVKQIDGEGVYEDNHPPTF